jgi:aspartyl-tRNA(Asn)/glutamyl-tRNA(Gln) amidotransferase subunit A
VAATPRRMTGGVLRGLGRASGLPVIGAGVRAGMLVQVGLRRLHVTDIPADTPPFDPAETVRGALADRGDPATPAPSPVPEGPPAEGIAALHVAYASGDTNPVEVAEAFLAAQPVGGPLDAFVSVDGEDVRRQARDAAARLAADGVTRPLDGVLVGIKDFIHVAGYLTRGGTAALVEEPAEDAAVVARLRDAGAIVAGKTRTTELGLSPIGFNAAGGSPRNPFDPRRPAGGSSSGSGAAVGGRLVPLALGTDGGGSVRIPAAVCGVFGLKTTFGRVQVGGHLDCGWWSLDTTGPLALTAMDLATCYAVMADVAPVDLGPLPAPPRVGVDWRWWGVPATAFDPRCRAALAGMDVHEVTVGHLDLVRTAAYVTIVTEMAAAVHTAFRDRRSRFTPETQLSLGGAAGMPATAYARAQQVRTLLARTFAEAFTTVDVIATPVVGAVVPPVPEVAWTGMFDQDLLEAMTAYTFPANLVGLPAIAVPVGTDADGMPVGLQLIGPHGAEPLLLRLAAALERDGVAVAPDAPRPTPRLTPRPTPRPTS